MINTNMKPLCDRRHGEMQAAVLFADAGTHGAGFRCRTCGRVYVPLRGYSKWEEGKPLGSYNPEGPRCEAHSFALGMYVREQRLDGRLVYACPEENCTSIAVKDIKND